MSVEAKPRKKILFVDDSVEFLEIFSHAMQSHSQGEWDILTAVNAGKALSILQEQQVSLVVIDVQMPLLDGLQLLKLIGMKHPNLPKVVLTGFPSPADRATSLANGADLYLEKPTSPEGIEMIFSTLNELAKVESEIGFQGTLRRVGLHDILQMECLGRNSTILEVFNKDTRGEIFIKNGSVIHAQANQLTGQPAFFFLLSISGGGFKLKPFTAPPEISITKSWEFLLMEAARRRDEVDIPGANASSEEAIEAAVENAQKTAAQSAAVRIPKIKFPTRKREPVQIREMAVFSGQGDVLYEFQCADVELRKRILQFVSEKSKQIGEGLKLGQFDLLEMQNARSRMVAQIQEDAGIYVSAYKTASAPAETAA